MKSLILAALLCLAALPALAQQGPLVSPAQTDLLGSSGVCATAPASNATSTCTITVPANQHAYINFLQVGACGDGTAGSAQQLAFTSTNLNGWTQQLSWAAGTVPTTTSAALTCVFLGGPRTHPLVSAAGPVSVTIVSPAATGHVSWPINVEYFLAQ